MTLVDTTTTILTFTICYSAGQLFGNTPAVLLGIGLLATGLMMRPDRR